MRDLRSSLVLCPNCRAEHDGLSTECARCGIIFAKYKPRSLRAVSKSMSGVEVGANESVRRGVLAQLRSLAFVVDETVNPFVFAGRALLFIGLVVWGWNLMTASIASNYAGESFLHLVNLPFHEAGHLFFMPFGRFMQVLGGSLGQLIMPLVCAGAFLVQQRNPFAASVALWWFGESLLDLAPYINDARALELVLIGGVTGKDIEDYHDWEYILRTLGWLEHDHTVASLAHGVGTLLMCGALAWGGLLLMQQCRRVR